MAKNSNEQKNQSEEKKKIQENEPSADSFSVFNNNENEKIKEQPKAEEKKEPKVVEVKKDGANFQDINALDENENPKADEAAPKGEEKKKNNEPSADSFSIFNNAENEKIKEQPKAEEKKEPKEVEVKQEEVKPEETPKGEEQEEIKKNEVENEPKVVEVKQDGANFQDINALDENENPKADEAAPKAEANADEPQKAEEKAEEKKSDNKAGSNNDNGDDKREKDAKTPELDQLKAMLMNNGLQKQIAAVGDNTWLDKLLKEGLLRTGNNEYINVPINNDKDREEIAKKINLQNKIVIADTLNNGFTTLEKEVGNDGKVNYKKEPLKNNTQEPPVMPLIILMFLAYCGFKIEAVEKYRQAKEAYDNNPEGHKNSEDTYKKAIRAFKRDVKADKKRIEAEIEQKEREEEELKKQKKAEKKQNEKDLKNKEKQLQKLEKEREKAGQKLEDLNKQAEELRKQSEAIKKQREEEKDISKKKNLDKQLEKLEKKQLAVAKEITGLGMDEEHRAMQEQNLKDDIAELRAKKESMQEQDKLEEPDEPVDENENKENAEEKAEEKAPEKVEEKVEEKGKVEEKVEDKGEEKEKAEGVKQEEKKDNIIDNKDDKKLQENPELKPDVKAEQKNINEPDAKGLDVPVQPEGEKAENKFSDKDLGLDGKADVKLFDDVDVPAEEKAEDKKEAQEEKENGFIDINEYKFDEKEAPENKANEPQPAPQSKLKNSEFRQGMLKTVESQIDKLMKTAKTINENSRLGIANKQALDAFKSVGDGIAKDMSLVGIEDLLRTAVSALSLSNDLNDKANKGSKKERDILTKALTGKELDDTKQEMLTGIRRFKEGPVGALNDKFNCKAMVQALKNPDLLKNLINQARDYQKHHPESMLEKGSVLFKNTLFKAPGSDKWEAMKGKTDVEINNCLKSLMNEENIGIFKDVRKSVENFIPDDKKQKQLSENLNALLENFQSLSEGNKLKQNKNLSSEKDAKKDNFVKETIDIAINALKELTQVGLPTEHDSKKSSKQTDKLMDAAAAVLSFATLNDDPNNIAGAKFNYDAKKLFKTMQNSGALKSLVKFGTEKLMGAFLDGKFDGKGLYDMVQNEFKMFNKMGISQYAQRCGSLFKEKGSDEWLPAKGANLKQINESYMQLLGSGKGRETVKPIPSQPVVDQPVVNKSNLSKAV